MNHPFNFYLLVFLLTFELATSQCPVTSLPPDWVMIDVPGSNYCYAIGNEKTNQATARGKCWSKFKGFLARFHDVTSLRGLARRIRINTKRIWIDLFSKGNGNWMWSDGTAVDSSVLDEVWSGDSGSGSGFSCAALTDKATPKYSKWMSELCTANHEFICQAPKLTTYSGKFVNSTLQVNGKCYAVSPVPMTFEIAVTKCAEKHNGLLAALENRELAVTVTNYFTFKKSEIKNYWVWTDIVWSQEDKIWQHLDGRKVTLYEENWFSPTQKIFTDSKSSVVLDQQGGWKWKSRRPTLKAFGVCEVDALENVKGMTQNENKPIRPDPDFEGKSDQVRVSGKAVAPDLVTITQKKDMEETSQISTSTTASSLFVDVNTLVIILGAVGVIFLILLIIICVLCYKKNACCLKKKKETQNGGFGTPVSFNFSNPEYGNISGTDNGPPRPDTPITDTPLPHLPLDGDDTYATITDDNPISPPISTVDLLHAQPTYSSLSLAGNTLSRQRNTNDASTLSLPRTHYSSRVSVNNSQGSIGSREPGVGRQMTSFVSLAPHTPGVRSPYYAQMETKKETPVGDQTALQYAELSFGGRDEEEQFEIGESCYVDNSMNRHNGSNRDNGENVTQQRFIQRYPDVRMLGNDYENENSPLVVSPDSPQFLFETA